MKFFQVALGTILAQVASGACAIPSLASANIDDLTTGLQDGCFTSVDLVNRYLARIAEVNGELHAVIELNPDALSIAALLDAERKNGSIRGPLHGIPIPVKDNIATFDQMNNTAGSYALVGARVPRDSGVVAKLRASGAIVLGKANMSQWAMFRSANTTSGWTSRGGQTYGPFYPQMDPYVSCGSGVAAALGLAFAALGTETRGSIIVAASKSNVVGNLVIPLTGFQDTVGPMAQTVLDAATVLSVIAGIDQYDNYTNAIPNNGKIPNYVAAARKYARLTGVRLGVPRNSWGDDLLYGEVNKSSITSAFEAGLDVLRGLGAEIVDLANFTDEAFTQFDFPLRSPNGNNQSITSSAGFISDLAAYFAELTYNPNDLHSVNDLINRTQSDPREGWPDRDTILWQGAASLGYNASDPRAYAAWRSNIEVDERGGVTGICNQLNLSALLIPTEYAPSWASAQGTPASSVPLAAYPDDAPIVDGLRKLIAVAPGIPFGLTFLGPHWSEEELIAVAAAFERGNNFRAKYVNGPNATVPKIELGDILSNGTCKGKPSTAPLQVETSVGACATPVTLNLNTTLVWEIS
ncbi:amidase [Tothia fuscella]|uniref:Amidase n=1 Tax=Tothia fuscella TaxID=1048955 RepID=A0A9P4P3C6_9PEZI|nr:amidase [Tothia fuscella]